MNSHNHGSGSLGEDNSSLSQDPAQTITITIMEPSSALGNTVDTSSVSASNLNNSNINSVISSGSGTTEEEATSAIISEKPEHILQTSISKTQLEEEFPVISNISNPEEEESLGQEVTKESEIYEDEADIAASSDPHCLVCNKELPQNTDDPPVAIFQVQTTATQRKMSVMLGVLVGQKITSRKSHSDLLCSRCYNLLDKVDSLEIELQDTKDDLINNYQSTYAIYGGRPRRKKAATAKKKEFVFPKIEPDEIEREDSLEFDSNFEPRAEDLLEEEADHQEDLVASGALDDEWEPEFKKPKLKRENTDADGGGAPKRRRGRPRKDITKAKETDKKITLSLLEVVHPRKILSQKKRYSCDLTPELCTTSFRTHIQFLKHKEEHVAKCLLQYSAILQQRGIKVLSSLPSTASRGRPKKAHECDVCERPVMFRTTEDRNKHISLVHPEKLNVMCQLCDMRFLNIKQFNLHILDHFHGKFECEFCDICFVGKYPLLKHMEESHSGEFLMKCEFCDFTTENFNEYRNHRKEPHIGYSSVCAECGELFPDDEKNEHNEEHLSLMEPKEVKLGSTVEVTLSKDKAKQKKGKNNDITCHYCEIVFSSPATLSRHNRSKHPQKYPYVCKTCSLRFKGSKSLDQHEDGHINGTFHCPVCNLKFRLHAHVEEHFQHSHRDIHDIECMYCKEKYVTYSGYKYHCRTVHSINFSESKDFKCSTCGEIFDTYLGLKKHRVQNHGTSKECPICKKNFVNLEVHVNTHTRAIPYPCPTCGEVFFTNSGLHIHNKNKHESKIYSCETCDECFSSQRDLRNHNDQVHLSKCIFFCDYCSRSYRSKSGLNEHLKIHTGEGQLGHKCKFCEKIFLRPSLLVTHINKTHNHPSKNQTDKVTEGEDYTFESSVGDVIEYVDATQVMVDNITVEEGPGMCSLQEVDMVEKINVAASEIDNRTLICEEVGSSEMIDVDNLKEFVHDDSEENVYIIQVTDEK